jgi:hypothetical protein
MLGGQTGAPSQPVVLGALHLGAMERQVRLWWIGVHGGSGESTLARLFTGSVAADHCWPLVTDGGRPTAVVLVARTGFHGLTRAQSAMREWSERYRDAVDVLGLALIADAPGRQPRGLRDLQARITQAVPRAWVLPWIEQWRVGHSPSPHNTPKQFRAMAVDLSTVLARHSERDR